MEKVRARGQEGTAVSFFSNSCVAEKMDPQAIADAFKGFERDGLTVKIDAQKFMKGKMNFPQNTELKGWRIIDLIDGNDRYLIVTNTGTCMMWAGMMDKEKLRARFKEMVDGFVKITESKEAEVTHPPFDKNSEVDSYYVDVVKSPAKPQFTVITTNQINQYSILMVQAVLPH